MLASVPPSPLSRSQALQAAFPSFSPAAPLTNHELHIIPQGAEPRWIMVGDPSRAVPVLRSWRPFNLSSRLRWAVVVSSAATGLLSRLPGVQKDAASLDLSYWRHALAGFREDWVPVVHIGNSSHTRKAILFFVSPDRVEAAIKVPLVAGANEAILNEADMLDRLRARDYLPRVLFRDRERGIAAQSWLEGKPISRKLTPRHMELLYTLAEPGQSVTVRSKRAEVVCTLDKLELPLDRDLRDRALALMDYDAPLPAFVEHRDFAPWNLKQLADGRLGLLDWEWAVPDSLPCQDLFRFFYIQDALFHGPGDVWQTLKAHPLLREYYRRFSIPHEALAPLVAYYLLRVLSMDAQSGSATLVKYSIGQLRSLLSSSPRP